MLDRSDGHCEEIRQGPTRTAGGHGAHHYYDYGKRTAPRATLRALSAAYVEYFVAHPDFLRMHLREGTSWVLSPAPNGRAQVWQDIHELQAGIFRRGIAAGVFIDEDPAYLAKLYSAIDQVLLADWVASGMKANGQRLTERFQALVERAFCRR